MAAVDRPTISELLQEYRRANGGLSDYEAAARAGVSQPLYQRWRSGRTVPKDDKAHLLADLLGRPQGDIEMVLAESRRRLTRDREQLLLDEIAELREEVSRLREEAAAAQGAVEAP